MRKTSFIILLCLGAALALASELKPTPYEPGKMTPELKGILAADGFRPIKVWIYFKDHGEKSPSDLRSMIEGVELTEHALRRRLNRSRGPLRDVHDLPPAPRYIEEIKRIGCKVRKTSKYFNAVSAIVTPSQLQELVRLDFVRKIGKVHTFHRRIWPAVEEPTGGTRSPGRAAAQDSFYGPSFKQLDLINVIPLHQSGVHGEGVLVAMLDTGFNRRHMALAGLDVIAEYDFVNNDSITSDQPGDPTGQHNHGTYTLSALGGYAPGHLIGPAWGASFILGKTEQIDKEIQVEEDDWVRGIEWADSIGAEVVSSSLGYFDWYTYADMDGNTAVTTRAADLAAGRGITVVTAAGNEGPLPWPGIIAPSDGDSVIAVGAVDSNGVVVSFSSRGPSYDGRIKPDVVAQGLVVLAAAAWDSTGFVRVSGTSLSTPLVGGVCALLLQMHPYWTPVDVINALKSAASRSSSPDNDYGWGIVNAYVSALNGSTGVEGAGMTWRILGEGVELAITAPYAGGTPLDLLRRKLLSGGRWSDFTMVVEGFLADGVEPYVFVDRDIGGGIYQYRLQVHGEASSYSDLAQVKVPWRPSLHQNHPNPFSPGLSGSTTITYEIQGAPVAPGEEYDISSYHDVTLDMFDVRGAKVKSFFSGIQPPGEYSYPWNGTDDRGRIVASGVYFYRLVVDGAAYTRKLVLINP